MAKQGHKLYASARQPEALKELHGQIVGALRVDVNNDAEITAAVVGHIDAAFVVNVLRPPQ